jgi:pimeloyl-ACP methyl ester carboxylesterase
MTATSKRDRIAGVALTLVGLHLVVLALATRGALAAIGAMAWLVAAPLLLRAFARGGRALRIVVTGVPGPIALAAGTIAHVGHAALNGPAFLDVTGILVAVAGALLVGLACEAAFTGTRRWTKLLALPLALLALQFYVFPVLVTGTIATNTDRHDVGALAGAEDVAFIASDGVRLRGWFVPGADKAVVVLHGSHGTRASTKSYIRLLHAAGYSVLAYDARGHGASGGSENAFGWQGDRDIAGAVTYLRGRGIERIAALGLSMGGEEALRAAANGVGVSAVIADGAGAGTLPDAKIEQDTQSPLFSAVTWIGMRTVALFSEQSEPAGLGQIVSRIRVPTLLIASNRRFERHIDSVFRDRIGTHATLWYVADAGHTQAFARHPEAYRTRVLGFLADALR